MGAAGRDFQTSTSSTATTPVCEVVAFTATQIPDIDDGATRRSWPASSIPRASPSCPRRSWRRSIHEHDVDLVRLLLQRRRPRDRDARRVARMAAGADFGLIGPRGIMLESTKPVVAVCAVRTGRGKSQTTRAVAALLAERGLNARRGAPPHALRRPGRPARAALRRPRRPRPPPLHHRGARGVRAAHRAGRRRLRRRRLRGHPARGREGGRRHPLGRRQQRPALLPARPATSSWPTRSAPATSSRFHPGEANLRMADVVVINKVDSATEEDLAAVTASIAQA